VLKALLAEPRLGLFTRSRLLAAKKACAYLNCSRATLHRLEETGALVPKRFGRKVVYERADLDVFMQKGGSTNGKLECPGVMGPCSQPKLVPL
jgi:hypothetical protein